MIPDLSLEKKIWQTGVKYICGIDEVGRGSLAGPLVCGAVILSETFNVPGIDDSKKLSRKKREFLEKKIKDLVISYAIGTSSVAEINNRGIQKATYLAFNRAIKKLSFAPDHLLIDYYKLPDTNIPQTPVKFGDSISISIAAASIIAKVKRDSIMRKLSRIKENEIYQFENNFGYGTRFHMDQIREFGAVKSHRVKYVQKITG